MAAEVHLVDEFTDRLLFGLCVAQLDHQVADVRLARVVTIQQFYDLVLREDESEFLREFVHTSADFFHAVVMSHVHDFLDGRRLRIIGEAQDVILALLIFAGEFHARDEQRITFFQHGKDLLAALDCVMVCQ